MIILLLTVICGFRGLNVGRDTYGYAYNYENQLLDWYEFGFVFIQEQLFKICPNHVFFFTIIAFFTYFFFVKRFYDFKYRGAAFYWCLLLFMATSYTVGFNGVRQWLAVSICFFATRYIYSDDQPKVIPYILLNLVAISIHNSSVFMLVFLAPMIFTKSNDQKVKLLRVFCVFAIGVSIYAGLNFIEGRNYGKLFEAGEYHFGYMSIVKIIVVLLALLQYHSFPNERDSWLVFNEGSVTIPYRGILLIECSYIALASLGYWFGVLSRIAWYLEPFETLFFANLFTKKTNSAYIWGARFLIVIIAIAKFLGNFSVTEMRFPYMFFWQ